MYTVFTLAHQSTFCIGPSTHNSFDCITPKILCQFNSPPGRPPPGMTTVEATEQNFCQFSIQHAFIEMNFPLPAKPGTHHPAPLPPPSLSSLVPSLPEASTSQTTLNGLLPSSVDPTICSVCSLPAKYTCPRCSTRTCSLDCSKTHKVKSSCSGERDPTKYVSLSKVGQGAWADDYRWLEEGRRKVAEWGNALPRDLMRDVVSHERGRGRGGMRGRGGKRRGGRDQGRFMLERELAKTGIHVTFMPEGMERKKKNQSAWNPK